MFIVLLKFSDNKAKAPEWMDGHNQWLKKGFEDGVFSLAGSLRPNNGGAIIAHGISREELDERVNADPFVAQNIVRPEILEIAPAKADERLQFLVDTIH